MRTTLFTNLGRLSLAFAVLALLGAWWTQLNGTSLFGLSQQHLFFDAMVLALLGIGGLLDGMIHRQAVA